MNSITSGSWKTSLMGLASILTALLALVHAGMGGTITGSDLTVFLTGITNGTGLLFSRDNDKSSESQGVTPQQLAAKNVLAVPPAPIVAHAPAAPATPPIP